MLNGAPHEPEVAPHSYCHRCLLRAEYTIPQPDGSELCPQCQHEHETFDHGTS